jgi:cell division GTPase FtsZ
MDMGLEEVENAAGLVEAAAHPEANIIFGVPLTILLTMK